MKLRKWQTECVEKALTKYANGESHFLTLATPGAGKTIMASELANQLLRRNLVDLVICFSPSSLVAKDFGESLQSITQSQFDGKMGAKGNSITYQSLQYLDSSFWQLFERLNVFVIFDEIHHCAGSHIENSNAWGEKILLNIQNNAKYTLALTGTPWRSDEIPITLSNYLPSNKISCDYVYGLSEALIDDVCRIPQIIAVDNNNISVTYNGETTKFNGFKNLLTQSDISYQYVIENEKVIKFIISSANSKLKTIRKINPNAGGLIVASSIEHATKIAALMKRFLNENCTLVSYKESNSTNIIQDFRHSDSKWIISVGMISEGTNIPRLQVCCHLANIKTEMHFRQILGRILRITSSTNQEAAMYIPAEPKLLEFAYRINQDIPFETDIVKFDSMKAEANKSSNEELVITQNRSNKTPVNVKLKVEGDNSGYSVNEQHNEFIEKNLLTISYEQAVDIFGHFKQEAIALGLSNLKHPL